MLAGQLYMASDETLMKENAKTRRLTRLLNATTEEEIDKRNRLCKDLFGHIGESFWIEPPFRGNYANNISIGNNFYMNYDCIIMAVGKVTIGDNVFLAPRVSIYTAGHPIDAESRNTLLEFGKPVTIGNNVWIGGNTVITPGVTIGDDVVIGAGSVVTKDIPSHTIAVGVPCKVIRDITDEDKTYWQEQVRRYQDYRNL